MIRLLLCSCAALTALTATAPRAEPPLPAPVRAALATSSRQSPEDKMTALDAYLFAKPPVPAPGFTLMGMGFVYQDDVDDSGEDFNPDGVSWPGWGDSEADPVGDPFELPEGLELVGPFKDYNESDPRDCDYKFENEAVGVGSLVQLCFVVRNTTNSPIRLELPPGIIFQSRSRDVQNGVLMHKVAFEVPANTVFFQPLFLHCTNTDFSPSGYEEEGYDMGPVQTHRAVQEIVALIADRQVDRFYFPIVSQAVTDLGNAGKISARTRRGLNALPRR